MLAGIPEGLYESIESIADLVNHPKETYAAIRGLLNSDDALGLMGDAVKQSFVTRFERMEADYQKAGAEQFFHMHIIIVL